MAKIYFSKNILHVHFIFFRFSLLLFSFLTHPSMILWSHLPLFSFYFFKFSPIFIFLSICFFFLLFVHLFLFILYGKINDPRIKSQILLCIVEIKLINFIIHKLNEFEQLIIIFKYIKYLINFINLDLMWIFNMF